MRTLNYWGTDKAICIFLTILSQYPQNLHGQSHLLTQTLKLTQLIIRINMYCVQTEPEDESFTSRTTTRGPLRCKMPDKGKLKATLPDVETPEDNNRWLKKKDYDRPDIIAEKKAELEKFFKFKCHKICASCSEGFGSHEDHVGHQRKNRQSFWLEVRLRLGYVRWATPPRSFPSILSNLRVPLVDETQ